MDDLEYVDLMTEGQPQVPTVDLTQPGYGDVMQPNPIAHLQVPPASPAEMEKRKSGWQQLIERFQTDANLQRAVGLAGAMLMQPKQPGQTNAGNLANAYVVGTNAYDLGKQAQMKQNMALREEQRKDVELGERVATGAVQREATSAGTELNRARLPGVQAESEIKVKTANDAIAQATTARQMAELQLSKGYNEEAVAEIERRLRAVKAFAGLSVDQSKVVNLELEAAEAKIEQAKAASGASRAQAEHAGAQTRRLNVETEGLEALPPDQRVGAMHPGSVSAVEQQRTGWRKAYQKLKSETPNSPLLAGKGEEEWVTQQMTAAKTGDTSAVIQRLANSLGDDHPYVQDLLRLHQAELRAAHPELGEQPTQPGAKSAPGKPGSAGKNEPVRITSQAEFDKLPSGTVFIGPDGKKRRKP